MKINDYYYSNNLTDIKPNDKECFSKESYLIASYYIESIMLLKVSFSQ